jgi:hypothetical protein
MPDDINRRGPISASEKDFIEEHHSKLTAQEIALALRRNPKRIETYINEHFSSSFQQRAKGAEYDIQSTPIWKDIQQQFSVEELDKFLYYWGRIVSQFRDDVYPTEQMQVVDCVKLEILMNRALNAQNKCINEIAVLEALLRDEQVLDEDQQDKKVINSLQRQVQVYVERKKHNPRKNESYARCPY